MQWNCETNMKQISFAAAPNFLLRNISTRLLFLSRTHEVMNLIMIANTYLNISYFAPTLCKKKYLKIARQTFCGEFLLFLQLNSPILHSHDLIRNRNHSRSCFLCGRYLHTKSKAICPQKNYQF